MAGGTHHHHSALGRILHATRQLNQHGRANGPSAVERSPRQAAATPQLLCPSGFAPRTQVAGSMRAVGLGASRDQHLLGLTAGPEPRTTAMCIPRLHALQPCRVAKPCLQPSQQVYQHTAQRARPAGSNHTQTATVPPPSAFDTTEARAAPCAEGCPALNPAPSAAGASVLHPHSRSISAPSSLDSAPSWLTRPALRQPVAGWGLDKELLTARTTNEQHKAAAAAAGNISEGVKHEQHEHLKELRTQQGSS